MANDKKSQPLTNNAALYVNSGTTSRQIQQ